MQIRSWIRGWARGTEPAEAPPVDREDYRSRRLEILRQHVDLARAQGLEIGAADFPVVAPDQGSCEFADRRTEYETARDFGLDYDDLARVAHLVHPERGLEAQIRRDYSYIVACHVLEHVIDPVGYLIELMGLLEPGGVLFLAVSDKRRTADALRPSTTFDELISRHESPDPDQIGARASEFLEAWDPIAAELALRDRIAFDARVEWHRNTRRSDIRYNVWQDRELFEQLKRLVDEGALKGVEIRVERPNDPRFNEFHVLIERTGERAQSSRGTARPLDDDIHYRTCNFCGSGRFELFKRLGIPFPRRVYGDYALTSPDVGERLELQYLRCEECGLTGINPLTHFADIDRSSFDGERNIVTWTEQPFSQYASEKLAMMKIIDEQYDFDGFRERNRVLDVSCGPGVALSYMRDVKGWEVAGVDPDWVSVREAREHYGIELENGLIGDVQHADESFDLIIMDNSLEHTFDPLSALLDAHRLLRPGGAFFIFVPNETGLSTLHLNANCYWGHWFMYSAPTLYSMLRRIGFIVPKLLAIQNPLNPDLGRHGIEIDPERENLRIRMDTQEAVDSRIYGTNFEADFFNLLAVKPSDAGVQSASEDEFRRIARTSRVERRSIVTPRLR